MREEHTRSKIGCGGGGRNTAIQLESRTISSLKTSPENTYTSSSAQLPWLSGKRGFQEHFMNNWLRAQSRILCSMYAQPFKIMCTQTHPSTMTGSLLSFYSKILGCSRIQIQKKSIKKQYPFHSSLRSATKKAPNLNKPLAAPANTSRWQNLNNKEPRSSC